MELLYSLLATFGVSLVALVGIVFFFIKRRRAQLEMRLLSFATGVLLATTFLELFPEAVEASGGQPEIFIASLVAMAAFFYIERFLHGFHTHHGDESHVHHHTSSRYLILIGDGVHNFIDGVAIAAAFLVSPTVGVATTLAVLAHELPHEFADYGILVRGGFSRSKALLYNFLSGLTAVVGALVTFAAGDFVTANLGYFIAATAGMFLYIAAANLIPELHHQRLRGRFMYGAPLLVGIILIAVISRVLE